MDGFVLIHPETPTTFRSTIGKPIKEKAPSGAFLVSELLQTDDRIDCGQIIQR